MRAPRRPGMKAVSGVAAACFAALSIGCGSGDVGGTWCSATASDDESCTGAVFAQFDERDDVVTGKVCERGFDEGCAAIGNGHFADDTFSFDLPNQDGRHTVQLSLSGD